MPVTVEIAGCGLAGGRWEHDEFDHGDRIRAREKAVKARLTR